MFPTLKLYSEACSIVNKTWQFQNKLVSTAETAELPMTPICIQQFLIFQQLNSADFLW